jgi:aspartokinase
MHNNDPRIVSKTVAIEQLSFDEAAELAYFGAKILHPTCIWPAQQENVPVKLLNTMQPEAAGTVITKEAGSVGVKAVAAKDGIIAIKEATGIKKYIVEIKPSAQTKPPVQGKKKHKTMVYETIRYAQNQAKWEAAVKYSNKHGYEFLILTEGELGITR